MAYRVPAEVEREPPPPSGRWRGRFGDYTTTDVDDAPLEADADVALAGPFDAGRTAQRLFRVLVMTLGLLIPIVLYILLNRFIARAPF